jgi:hypothetical protein
MGYCLRTAETFPDELGRDEPGLTGLWVRRRRWPPRAHEARRGSVQRGHYTLRCRQARNACRAPLAFEPQHAAPTKGNAMFLTDKLQIPMANADGSFAAPVPPPADSAERIKGARWPATPFNCLRSSSAVRMCSRLSRGAATNAATLVHGREVGHDRGQYST